MNWGALLCVLALMIGYGLGMAYERGRAWREHRRLLNAKPHGMHECNYQWSDEGKEGCLVVLRCNLPDGHAEREHVGTLWAVVHRENRKELHRELHG